MIARLEGCAYREVELAARWIWCDILEPAQRLVAEVRDLWIETCVPRPRLEVTSAELDTCVLGVAVEETRCHRPGQVIAEGDLADLDKAIVLEPDVRAFP